MVGLSETEKELLLRRADLTGTQSLRMDMFLSGRSLNEIAGVDGITRESVNSTLAAASTKLIIARRSLG